MKIIKSVCIFALVIFSLSAQAVQTPMFWTNYVDGVYYSTWAHTSGDVPGPVNYQSHIQYEYVGQVVANFASNGVSAEEVAGGNTCMYRGQIIGTQVTGTVLCANNPSHRWTASIQYGP